MTIHYKKTSLIFTLIFFSCSLVLYSQEEFVGPFKSWANVRTMGAHGDGIDDDTKILQSAIDNLSNRVNSFNIGAGAYVVIYLPAGTYKISQTLMLKGKIGVSIIGEDPSNTTILWAGRNNDTMLLANGSAYFKISRLTWNANHRSGIEGIGIHWKDRWNDGKSQSFASLNIEISDNIFSGGFAVGIGGGTSVGVNGTGSNDSEITIRRCVFNGCTEAGIMVSGYNALDYWIWDSRFINCRFGIYNAFGNYHVYKSFFNGSLESDILNKSGYYTSVRQCYSLDSKEFSKDDGRSCNPFKRVFEKNTVINCTTIPVEYYHLGSLSLMDNTFSMSRNKDVTTHMNLGSWCPGHYNVLSINNKYGYAQPIYLAVPLKTIFRDKDSSYRFAKLTKAIFDTSRPLTPLRVKRKIFEVPLNASSTEIQRIINEAAQLKGSRPVIHFPFNEYLIDQTLTIPEGTDMQIIGDGFLYASVLKMKTGKPSDHQPLLLVRGPSYITIHDIQIGSSASNPGSSAAIVFQNVDQKNSMAILDQVYSMSDTSLYINGLNYLYVEKNNSFFTAGNYISGGTIQKAGKGSLRLHCFGGQFTRLMVLNNANFVAKDCWWEGNTRVPLNIKGDGNITIDGAMIAPIGADSNTTVQINEFTGKITLMNMYLQGGLYIRPENKNLQLLAWNIHFYYKMNPLYFISGKSSFRAIFAGLSTQCFSGNPACGHINTIEPMGVNVPDAEKFMQDMSAECRKSQPARMKVATKGVSNIYISRVSVGVFEKGFVFF